MTLPKMKQTKQSVLRRFRITAVAAVIIPCLLAARSFAAAPQKSFASPEEAVQALVTALKSHDQQALLTIFGPAGEALILSGDAVADRAREERFLSAYDEKNSLVPQGDTVILQVGKSDWPFPIPIVKKSATWMFDTDKGREELLNRRIGENELSTIQVLLAIVDAQREYAMRDRDGHALLEYAQKFRSDPGKKNGLYWETQAGEEPSPLGPLAAQARKEGYGGKQSTGQPAPYHGYFFKILMAQGQHASGGAYDYVVKGKMIGGFAVVAYPATYGNSGVMTFLVNHDGVVYEKDLGPQTAKTAAAMRTFDPDNTWKRVE
jgi:hypothetical protein